MARPSILRVDIVADARGVGRGVDEADRKFGKLGGAAKLAGAAVAGGLAVGVAAAGAFAFSSIKAASDVEQSFGAVESVFGKAAGQVKGYANGAATSLGLAKGEYASLAATVGSQLQGMGKSQAESATETQKLIGTGADLAATFGGSVADAVGAVGSLLRGERDPIEKYGVAITAADVAARLAAEGNDKLTGSAKKTAEANATLAILTEKTKNAHGAFGRESNTLAGQQERLRAQFENVKATVGAGLTPVLTAAAGTLTGKVLPGAQRVAEGLARQLGPALSGVSDNVRSKAGPAFAAFTDYANNKLRPALAQVGTFLTTTVLPAFSAVAGFVVQRVVPAVLALSGAALTGLRAALGSIQSAIGNNRAQLETLGRALGSVAGFALKLAPVVGTVLTGAFRVVGGTIGAVIGIVGRMVSAVQRAIELVRSLASAARAVGGVVGKLNPFSAPLAGMTVPLVGGVDLAPRTAGLTTAAFGDGGLVDAAAGGRQMAGGLTVLDRRQTVVNVRVDGALDPVGVARQIEDLLTAHGVRLGRTA